MRLVQEIGHYDDETVLRRDEWQVARLVIGRDHRPRVQRAVACCQMADGPRMNSKRHSRLRNHQRDQRDPARAIRKLRRRIADAAAAEVFRMLAPRLSQMFSGEMHGGVVAPGSLKFDRAKFMEVSGEAVLPGGRPFGVIVDELHEG